MAFNEKIIEVQGLLDKVNTTLASQKTALDLAAQSIGKYASGMNKMPSDFLNAQKESIALSKAQQAEAVKLATIDKQAEAVKQAKLNTEIKLNAQKKSSIALSTAQANAEAKAAMEINNTALANEKLNRAYVQLNNQRTVAKNKLQDLIASEVASNKEIRIAQKEFDVLDKRVQKANKAVGNFSNNVGNYKSALSGVGTLMGAFGISTGLYLGAQVVKDIYETTKQLQSLDLALKMVSETEGEFASNQEFITTTAEKWGLEIKSLTQQYTQFYTASKGLLSGEDIKSTFEGIAKAGSIMGLSLEKQSDAFYAIDQMMSKGTVTAEELKKQLGNAMPGAIKAAAMAYMDLHPAIKTIQEAEKELYAAMKKGALDSATYVPLIVKNLNKIYGTDQIDKVETLMAAQNRLSNSWTEMIRSMNDSETGGISLFFGFMMDRARQLLDYLTKINDSFGTLNKKTAAGGVEIGANAFKMYMADYKPLSESEKSAIQKRIDEINDLIKKDEKDGYGGRFEAYDKEQKELNDKLFNSDQQQMKKTIHDSAVNKLKELKKEYSNLNNESVKLAKEAGLKGADFNYFVSRTKDPQKKLGLTEQINAQLELIRLSKEVKSIKPTNIPDDGKGIKEVKERIRLNLKLADSEYALQMAILEGQKAEIQFRLNDDRTSLDDRIKLRQEFSDKSIEIMDLELKREKAINEEKYIDEIDKANKAYFQNKKNGYDDAQNYREWQKNLADTKEKYTQEGYALDVKYNTKWNELMEGNADFYRKIEEKKLEYTRKTAELILKTQQDAFKKIADDEKYTIELREKSFQKYLELKKKELEVEYLIANAKATSTEEKANLFTQYILDLEKLNTLGKEESPWAKERKEFEKYLDTISNGQFNKALDDIGMSSAKMFLDLKKHLDENGKEVWTSAFDDMYKQAVTFKEKFALVFQTVGDIAQDAFNLMSEAATSHYDAEYERLERQRDISLQYAGESATGRAEIERQYERERRKLQRQEAKDKKSQAQFNIAIDTAQAIVAFLAKGQWGQAIAAGILGGIQLAVVSSREIPAYWRGTDYVPNDQMATTQEKGQEIITDAGGKIKDMGDNKGARLTYLKKGDKVLNHQKTLDQLSFSKSYGNLLSTNNILPPIVDVSSGLTREEYNAGITELKSAIGSKPSFTLIDDENGRRLYREHQGQRTELISARKYIKTIDV